MLKHKFGDMYLRYYLRRNQKYSNWVGVVQDDKMSYNYNANNPNSICGKIEKGIGDSSDNIFLKDERECLAACCGAPMMQVNHKYYENVTIELLDEIIGTLKDEK